MNLAAFPLEIYRIASAAFPPAVSNAMSSKAQTAAFLKVASEKCIVYVLPAPDPMSIL